MSNFSTELSLSDLATVSGGNDLRNAYVKGGGLIGGAGGSMAGAAGAAALTAPTGPGAVAAGLAGRAAGGAGGTYLGGKIGGALYDTGSWIGTKVGNWLYPSK